MISFEFNRLNRHWRLWVLAAALTAGQGSGYAENMKVELRLVWGTNAEKSPDPTHKPLDAGLADELRKVCKWHHYFVINRTNVTLNSRQTQKVEMSKKCVIEIKELEGQRVEVQLIGEGIKRDKVIKPLPKKKSITFAGEGENATAWFVIIKQAE